MNDVRLSENTDEILCYCGKGVATKDFISAARASPKTSFENLCRQQAVGQQCTACLLNAESVYYAASRNVAPVDGKLGRSGDGSASPVRRQGLKAHLFGLADRILPHLAKPRREIAPILVGSNLTTYLAISNEYPIRIQTGSAAIKVKVRVLNEQGQLLSADTHVIRRGERLDLDLGSEFERPKNSGSIALGSCWMDIHTIERGTVGSIRPHFSLLTSSSCSNLHTQAKNLKEQVVIVVRDNLSERQFVSHINIAGTQARILCEIRAMSCPDRVEIVEALVDGHGSSLVELPFCTLDGAPIPGPYEFRFSSDKLVRRHWLAASSSLDMISADHV